MTIIKKRIVFFMMALLTGLLLTTAFQPFAQAVESPTISTPAAIQGLDEYISTSPTGAFTLNEDAALTDGYSQEAINMVEHQLFIMNDLSRSKKFCRRFHNADSDHLPILSKGTRREQNI